MPQLRFLAGLLVFSLVLGCKAQTPPAAPSASLDRRIEVLVRSQYSLPADVTVQIGARGPSQFPGYQTLPITISLGTRSQLINFLISEDSTKLVHLDTMDLTRIPSESIDTAGRPIRGNPNAKVTVINFDDLECPYCARMHQELFPATIEHYKDQVRFIYKDDPLTEIHPWAMHAAVDANCLAQQNGEVYWNYVDYLHTHGDEITGPDRNLQKSDAELDRVAQQEGTLGKLDSGKLSACIAKQDETAIRAEQKQAEALNIDGTPAVFVNGERVNGGAVPKEQLWAVIDRALRAEGDNPPPADTSAPAGHAATGAGNESK
ncbi:MAG: DsbA family protein [Acidobacteriota bacterium]